MKIEFEGKVWSFELEDVTNKQTKKALEYAVAESLGKLVSRLENDEDPGYMAAWEAVYWLVGRQNGEDTPIADVEFAWPKFAKAFAAALAADETVQAAAAAAAEPDPTRPAVASESSPEPSSPEAGKAAVSGAGAGGPPDG